MTKHPVCRMDQSIIGQCRMLRHCPFIVHGASSSFGREYTRNQNTKEILAKLLETNKSFDDGILDAIISAFIAQCEKDSVYPWTYYYVKYPTFRPGSYGKMSNDDVEKKPYMFSVMQTKTQWSQNTYMPYLKECDDAHLSKDEMGQYLVYDDVYIACENDSYGVYNNEDDSLVDTVSISQNDDGIDTEDRIIKLKKYVVNIK